MSAEIDLEKSGFSEHQNKSAPEVNMEEGTQCYPVRDSLTTHEPTDTPVRLRKRKEMREDRNKARLDSMVLLIMKLDQLDQDIERMLSAPAPLHPAHQRTCGGTFLQITCNSDDKSNVQPLQSSPSDCIHSSGILEDLKSGSESGADTFSVNQTQANLPSNAESTDLPSSTPLTISGTKPKATERHA